MSAFLIDFAFKTIQILISGYFFGQFIRATPRKRFYLLFVGLLACVNALSYWAGDRVLFVRIIGMQLVQILLIIRYRKIPVSHALVYFLLSSVLVVLMEFPIDMSVRAVIPEGLTLTDLPNSLAVTINIMYLPFFIASFGISNLLCGKLYRMGEQEEFRYYVPFLLIQCLEIHVPMVIVLSFAEWYWMTAILGCLLLLVHAGMLLLLAHTFSKIQRGAESEAEARQTQEALAFQISYYHQIHEHIASIRKIRHDMKNQLQATLYLLEGDHVDRAKEQLQEALFCIEQANYDLYTGNTVADAVISAKAAECQRSGIGMHVDGQLPEELSVSGVDICSVFSNLLDNALRACEKLPAEERKIDLKIQYTYPQLRIACENPSSKNCVQKKHSDIGMEHGWGLTILKSIAEKYGGDLEVVSGEQTVTVILWLMPAKK